MPTNRGYRKKEPGRLRATTTTTTTITTTTPRAVRQIIEQKKRSPEWPVKQEKGSREGVSNHISFATPPEGSPCPGSVGRKKGPLNRTKTRARGRAKRNIDKGEIREPRSTGLLQRMKRNMLWTEAKNKDIERNKEENE